MKTFWISAAAIVSILGLLALIFFLNFEFKTENQAHPPSRRASEDAFLALEMTLRSRGLVVERITRDEKFWKRAPALVITDEALLKTMNADQEMELSSWFARKGRLIILWGSTPWKALSFSSRMMLRALGLRVSADDNAPAPGGEGELTWEGHATALRVEWSQGAQFFVNGGLEHVPSIGRQGEVLRWILLAGSDHWLLTTSTEALWTNAGLGKADHAQLLGLVTDGLTSNRVLLLTESSGKAVAVPEAWLALMPPALVFFALLIWCYGPRREPLTETQENSSRSLAERFSAEGRFLWRQSGREEIAERLSSDFARTLARKLPTVTETERLQVLEKLTSLPMERWAWVLSPDQSKTRTPQDFIQFMTLIEQARKAL